MNIEELRALKERLESIDEKFYVPFCISSGDSNLKIGVCSNIPYATLDDYENNDYTTEYVKTTEKFIEACLRQITRSFLPIDALYICSQNIVLVDLPYVREFYKLTEEKDKQAWFKNLHNHVNNKYVPLNLTLNVGWTGIQEGKYITGLEDLADYNLGDKLSKTILNDGIFGIVDIEKFIQEIKKLGYDVINIQFRNGFPVEEEINDSRCFINDRLLEDDGEYTASLNIVADFGRKEKRDSSRS